MNAKDILDDLLEFDSDEVDEYEENIVTENVNVVEEDTGNVKEIKIKKEEKVVMKEEPVEKEENRSRNQQEMKKDIENLKEEIKNNMLDLEEKEDLGEEFLPSALMKSAFSIGSLEEFDDPSEEQTKRRTPVKKNTGSQKKIVNTDESPYKQYIEDEQALRKKKKNKKKTPTPKKSKVITPRKRAIFEHQSKQYKIEIMNEHEHDFVLSMKTVIHEGVYEYRQVIDKKTSETIGGAFFHDKLKEIIRMACFTRPTMNKETCNVIVTNHFGGRKDHLHLRQFQVNIKLINQQEMEMAIQFSGATANGQSSSYHLQFKLALYEDTQIVNKMLYRLEELQQSRVHMETLLQDVDEERQQLTDTWHQQSQFMIDEMEFHWREMETDIATSFSNVDLDIKTNFKEIALLQEQQETTQQKHKKHVESVVKQFKLTHQHHLKLAEKHDKLNEEHLLLSNNHDALKEHHDELAEAYEQLQEHHEALKQSHMQLQDEQAITEASSQELRGAHAELSTKVQSLTEQNGLLKQSVDNLSELSTKVQSLTEQNGLLKQSVDDLSKTNSKLEQRTFVLESKLEKLLTHLISLQNDHLKPVKKQVKEHQKTLNQLPKKMHLQINKSINSVHEQLAYQQQTSFHQLQNQLNEFKTKKQLSSKKKK